MSSKGDVQQKPWCPFCGIDVGRPTDNIQRQMTEFPSGVCECGALYVCDATGHNVGSAMVECLVNACGGDGDLAWELVPEEDYLTGRLEDYDDVTHQVVPKRNLDGRAVRGVLYFVRLHKDMAEVVSRFQHKLDLKVAAETEGTDARSGSVLPQIEPERDPKRQKQRADKRMVKKLSVAGDIDALVDLCFDDKRTLRFMQRLLYTPDSRELYHLVWTLGQVCARVATREPGQVADLLHRLFESSADSASSSWGMVEAIGAIIANRTDIYGAFTRHLMGYLGDPVSRNAVLWGLCEIAATRPDLIRKTSFYSLFTFLNHEDPITRGLIVRLLGLIKARETALQLIGLQQDQSEITLFIQGSPVQTTVAALAEDAGKKIHGGSTDGE